MIEGIQIWEVDFFEV